MDGFAAIIALWLASAALVYALLVLPPLLYFADRRRSRITASVLAAGLLGPGGAGGHGILPLPSAIGLLFHGLGDRPDAWAVALHAGFWLGTTMLFLLIEYSARRALRRRLPDLRASAGRLLRERLLGRLVCFPLQWLAGYASMVLISALRPPDWLGTTMAVLVLLTLLGSSIALGYQPHRYARDYYFGTWMILGLAVFIAALSMGSTATLFDLAAILAAALAAGLLFTSCYGLGGVMRRRRRSPG